MSTMADIRRRYGVPAKRGLRVVVNGKPGVITATHNQYLRVRFDGQRHSVNCHPTWRFDYAPLPPPPPKVCPWCETSHGCCHCHLLTANCAVCGDRCKPSPDAGKPPSKSEVQLSSVLAAAHTLKLGLNQRGRIALYSNADRWLCYLDEDSVPALRAIADALDKHFTDSEKRGES